MLWEAKIRMRLRGPAGLPSLGSPYENIDNCKIIEWTTVGKCVWLCAKIVLKCRVVPDGEEC